tara:strand:+ start:108 stop:1148 length:1041 start_codon:yes stop_codon:yes gene_type:complete
MKKGVLWIGRKGRSVESIGFADKEFMRWIYKETPFNVLADTVYDSTQFSIKQNRLYFRDSLLKMSKYDTAIFTFNAEWITKENYKKIEEVYFWIKENTEWEIINKLPDFRRDAQKEKYFSQLKINNIQVPNYSVINKKEDLLGVKFPYLLKFNNIHQWKKVYNIEEAEEYYNLLSESLRKDQLQEGLKYYEKFSDIKFSSLQYDTKIIAVEFIDNFNGKYCSASSVSFIKGEMFYQYSLCCPKRGVDAIHIADVTNFDFFRDGQLELEEVINSNKETFKRVARLSLDTAKIDFLIVDGKPVFLEQGLKFGTSFNAIRSLEPHYPKMKQKRSHQDMLNMISRRSYGS